MTNIEFRIFPQPVRHVGADYPSLSSIKGITWPIGLACAIVFFIMAWPVIFLGLCDESCRGNRIDRNWFIFWASTGALMLCGVLVFVLNSFVKRLKRPHFHARLLQEAKSRELQRVNEDALRTTRHTKAIYDQAIDGKKNLTTSLEQANSWLMRASQEFHASAFSPYWDAIQNAASHLGHFEKGIRILSELPSRYSKALSGEEHSFPEFPVKRDEVPDSSKTIEQFYQVYRLGQTKYEFAQIWEHYKDRKVMIAGFSSLHDAINNLGGAIENSISDFHQSFSTEFAGIRKSRW